MKWVFFVWSTEYVGWEVEGKQRRPDTANANVAEKWICVKNA